MPTIAAYGAIDPTSPLKPLNIERREPDADDVVIDITHCGVCHSDMHFARNDLGFTRYPIVPGHEIVGRVSRVGSNVNRFSPGDRVAVGCIVNSCQSCPSCEASLEQYCDKGIVGTYGGLDPKENGAPTHGGYSRMIVVDHRFVLRVPENLDPAATAPLLCAGVTTWSPLREWNVGKGQTVGVIGLGGLGHMGVKFAHALGAHVVMVTTSPAKGEDAKSLGADDVLLSTDANAMRANSGRFDFLLNTIPVGHNINPYLKLLKRDGTMVLVGPLEPLEGHLHSMLMLTRRRRIAGSMIGGIKETQEMLDFCGEHNIVADIEVINMNEINTAYSRMEKNDIKYRFVIDMASLTD